MCMLSRVILKVPGLLFCEAQIRITCLKIAMQEKDISLAIGSHNYTEYKIYQICFSLPFMKGLDFLKPTKQEKEIKESITA